MTARWHLSILSRGGVAPAHGRGVRLGQIRILRDGYIKLGRARRVEHPEHAGRRCWRAITPDLTVLGHYATLPRARRALMRAAKAARNLEDAGGQAAGGEASQ